MNSENVKNDSSSRKKDHIEICLNDDVAYKKSNGFDKYEFRHYAITEVEIDKIDFSLTFLKKKINLPFLISCMTGGTSEANKINAELAIAAQELKIPIGVGSQRQAFENSKYHDSYKVVREKAPGVPVLGNIGAAQIAGMNGLSSIKRIIDLIEADALVIHFNPLQELIQMNGEPNFSGVVKNIKKILKNIRIPLIIKEVGAGIDGTSAEKLIKLGIKGIDVSGAGGTSWSAVEYLRNREADRQFWDWGLPTSFCIREIKKLKKKFDFFLIASGGISNATDIAKAYALGADLTASARPLLKEVAANGPGGVIKLVGGWFEDVKKIMYLTGSPNLKSLSKNKLIKKSDLY